MRKGTKGWGLLLASVLFANGARADEVTVAVAANFLEPLKAMAPFFEKKTGHKIEPRPGSTGELYAQITNDAPYDVFLSADVERPKKLIAEGKAVKGSRFTYAIGRVVLWSPDEKRIPEKGKKALEGDFKHIALADPKTAPYGLATKQALEKLKLWKAVEDNVVYGQNISQTLQFLTSGNAELGFVALSQLDGPGKKPTGSRWLVPKDLHEPIEQDAVLLVRAKDSKAAKSFLDYLQSKGGRKLIRAFGYEAKKE